MRKSVSMRNKGIGNQNPENAENRKMLHTIHSSVVGSNIALHTLLAEDRNNKTDKRRIKSIRSGFWTCFFPSQLPRLDNSNSLEKLAVTNE